jgi:hypothetical protein
MNMASLFASIQGLSAVASPHSYSGYVVGWGTLALINAGLAQAKRRSGLLWFLLSLLLGPIATFLIVIFDAERQQPAG